MFREMDPDEPEKTISDESVVGKYAQAAEIANRVLKKVIEKCVDGASCREISDFGDELIAEECTKVFKKEKEMKRGIAFPTCVSANNCICHFSPIKSEPDYILKNEDVVKIDLGAHIDGFIAVVAHTIIVGASPTEKITGRKADVFLAAYHASQAALRLLKPKADTYTITDTVQKVCKEYDCKPIEGMLSHQLSQFRIDGQKTIIQNPTEAQRKEHEKFEISEYEVYAMDVLVSSGTGVGREQDARVSIYKKTDEIYQLKLKASRMFYAEVVKKYGSMPFNLRSFEDERSAKMGVVECVNHKLLNPFQVLYEKPGEFVVQFKFTVMVLPNGPSKITGLPLDESLFESNNSISDPELKVLLQSSLKHKPTKKKKKPAKSAKTADALSNNVEKMDIDSENKMEVEQAA
ncbi:proliferation-associated protein 2G4 [Planococcus citri]|uniref:proliferation-associated protein 2G4 n=1 Tax=Planococcus citri TaxID=170843 RepID=UPI0031F7C9B4